MQQNYEVVIAEASCFILLDKIGELNILQKVFKQVVTTDVVSGEFVKALPDWIKVEPVENNRYQELLQIEVDPGEASIIALAFQYNNPVLILDDYKARKLADRLKLTYTGTLGILLKAKESGDIVSVKSILGKIQQTNFRFSDRILQEILHQAGE